MEEKYYKLSLLRKTEGGAEWQNIYFKVYGNGEPELVEEPSNFLNSKLEKISKKEHTKRINDSQHDFSYG